MVNFIACIFGVTKLAQGMIHFWCITSKSLGFNWNNQVHPVLVFAITILQCWTGIRVQPTCIKLWSSAGLRRKPFNLILHVSFTLMMVVPEASEESTLNVNLRPILCPEATLHTWTFSFIPEVRKKVYSYSFYQHSVNEHT